jgi:hypothetical protein
MPKNPFRWYPLTSNVGIIGSNATDVGTPVYEGTNPWSIATLHVTNSTHFLKIQAPMIGLNKGTLEFWYKFDNATPAGGNYDTLYDNQSGQRCFIYRKPSSQDVDWGAFYGSTITSPTNVFTADTNWHRFQFFWDTAGGLGSSKTAIISIDGTEKSSQTAAITNTNTTDYLYLGNLVGPQHPIEGYMSNFKIYDYIRPNATDMLRFRSGMNDLCM